MNADEQLGKQLGPLPDSDWTGGTLAYTAEQMLSYAAQEVAAERERCLEICERHYSIEFIAQDIAAEIRGPNDQLT